MTGPLRFAANLVCYVWWAPTLLLHIGRLACRVAYFRIRLYRVSVLRRTGHLDAAKRALDQIEIDAAGEW